MEILQAVMKFVLIVFALITAGIEKVVPPPPGTFVNPDPSPINLAKMVPAEIVEKNPLVVEIEFVKTSPIVIYPVVPPICRVLTVNDEIKPRIVDIEVVEILQAVIKLVLSLLALITAGTAKPPPPGTFVNKEPSPTNLA